MINTDYSAINLNKKYNNLKVQQIEEDIKKLLKVLYEALDITRKYFW